MAKSLEKLNQNGLVECRSIGMAKLWSLSKSPMLSLLKNKKLTSFRQLVPPVFVLVLVLLLVFALFEVVFFSIFIAVISVYLVTDFVVSLSLCVKRKKATLMPLLFVSFPCLHFPWAFGFIVRLLTKPKLGQYWKY